MCVRIANTFELRTTNSLVSFAAESLDDRQTWLVKLARVSISTLSGLFLCTQHDTVSRKDYFLGG